MHPKNPHQNNYNFDVLQKSHKALSDFVILTNYGQKSIDFSNPKAVLELNKALLKLHYNAPEWSIPEGYLCPPIPGRLDYLLHLNDLLGTPKKVKGLDIGVGANCIYPILASQHLGWQMVGSDIDVNAVKYAQQNALNFKDAIEIRHQNDNANIFSGIIKEGEFYDFTMCNPPFHSTEKEATAGSLRKVKNLNNDNDFKLNFGGQANELWCNGGEALFIKRIIKQSVLVKNHVKWFTCLVSKSSNLPKIYKQLNKLKASYSTIDMEQGSKKSRFVAWHF